MTTFADQLYQFGGSPVGLPIISGATYLFVSPNGADGNSGSMAKPLQTLSRVAELMDGASVPFVIGLAPGEYDEAATIARPSEANAQPVFLIGVGPRGSVYIAPSTTNATGLTNHRDDVTLINVGCDGDGTGNGLTNTGSRLRAYGCKFETDTGAALQLTLGTVAQEAAGTRGVGADILIQDCETAWATNGVLLTCTDYGAVTQAFFRRNKHHNHTNHFNESTGSGGAAGVMFRNLEITDSVFDDAEDGTAPTAFLLLNDDNANTGIVTRNSFPTAINSGKNLVSTALHWVCNYHTGGVSTAQPS